MAYRRTDEQQRRRRANPQRLTNHRVGSMNEDLRPNALMSDGIEGGNRVRPDNELMRIDVVHPVGDLQLTIDSPS